MQIPRPSAVGDPAVVQRLRSILFSEPILGAATVRPKGLTRAAIVGYLLGWLGPIVTRKMTDPLPPTPLYLAVTTVDIRLFAKPLFGDPYEIGRWRKGSYRASATDSRLELELERLGKATVHTGAQARPVVELVVQGASAPVV